MLQIGFSNFHKFIPCI